MKLQSTRLIVISGFLIFSILLISVTFLWIYSTYENKNKLTELANSQTKRQLIFVLRDVVHKRVISLTRMASLSDPFDIDEEYTHFKQLAEYFITARNLLFSVHLSEKENIFWHEIKDTINRTQNAQNMVVELIVEGRLSEARRYIQREVIPLQDKVLQGLTRMLDVASAEVHDYTEQFSARNSATYRVVMIMAVVFFLLGLAVMIYVWKKSTQIEKKLRGHADRIRELYELTSETGKSIDEQLEHLLRFGCELLNMELAQVNEIDEDIGSSKVLAIHAPGEKILPGKVTPLEFSLCKITIDQAGPVAINDISHSAYNKYPSHEFSALESYIADSIYVNGKRFGTISFASHVAKKHPHSNVDLDLVKLMAKWVGFILDKKIAQDELSQAKDQAEEANLAKSKFLANMSHELRTPLNAIIGYSELLTEEILESNDRAYVNDLDKINASGMHLLSLINDVLDLSKIEAGKVQMVYEDFDLVDLLNDVLVTIKVMLSNNKNELKVNLVADHLIVHTDAKKMKQILLNLLSNANKFTKNGTITVSLLLDGVRKGWYRIVVTDSGLGMNKAQINKIFQPFVQAGISTENAYGGTGLGLPITKRICEMMGGYISVESRPNRGSSFSVELPIIASTELNHFKTA